MYVISLGYGTTTVVETQGTTDTFAVTWGVRMLNCLGLSDITLQCDPEPSLIKWAECVKSKRQERTVIRSSPRRSHQSNRAVENYQKQLQGQVNDAGSAPRTNTIQTDHWVVRPTAWLISRFRENDVQSPFCRAMGGPYHGRLLEFAESVLAHLP